MKRMTPEMPETPTAIADGVLVWSCESEDVTEKVDIDDKNGGGKVQDEVSRERARKQRPS